MKISTRFWALSITRIQAGNGNPAMIIERITLKEPTQVAEGARIEHPRLGTVALFSNKTNLADEATRLLSQHNVDTRAFLKRYGHWVK